MTCYLGMRTRTHRSFYASAKLPWGVAGNQAWARLRGATSRHVTRSATWSLMPRVAMASLR